MDNTELRQAAWFYAANLASFVAPLLMIAYVARVLGPAEWGKVSVFHSLGLYASQVIEYGFGFTASRDIARNRDDRTVREEVVSKVNGAKLALGCVVAAGALALYPVLPAFMRDPLLFAVSIGYALAQGATMLWYFQGMGRLAQLAKLDLVYRSIAAIATMSLVRMPGDGWWMITCNMLACAATAATGLYLISLETPVRLSSAASAARALRSSFPMFVFRGASSLYSSANGFLLGLLSGPASAGYYSGAERAYRGLTALLHPVMQLLYAKVSHAAGDQGAFGPESRRVARQSALLMAGWGTLLGIGCAIAAPWLIRGLLGTGFDRAVPVLRLLGVALCLEAAGVALGIQWMLPLGLDKQFTLITILAGCSNVAVAYWLAPTLHEAGMALAVVTAHGVLAAACFVYLRHRGLDPFQRGHPA